MTLLALAGLTGATLVSVAAPIGPANADNAHTFLFPGNLLVSRSVYQGDAGLLTPGTTMLPPGCIGSNCVAATNDGSYPGVWNNDHVDGSFGITAPIFLDQITPNGHYLDTVPVPTRDLVTSFPSKSEIGLNLSTNGRYITFMGYSAPVNGLDVSNSNTPGAIDPTNPVPGSYFRTVAQMDSFGHFTFTETNAYSGNNGRAAILNDSNGADVYYTSGNGGNGGNPQPASIITGTGAQLVTPSRLPERLQRPGATTPVGSFNITQLGDKPDKIGKDDNFRGLTVFDNVVYFTKGSGGNGVNTVYFIDTTGKACPSGVGVPQPGATLPTTPLSYNPATVQQTGLPNNMCVLAGFPTALKSTTSFPFGVWFANPDTAYVTDEGNGDTTYSAATNTYTTAAGQTMAGLQKWVRSNGVWHLAYTLANGLNLGAPYPVRGYPTGDNAATGLPWAPATDGLRNITGRVNRDGTVTLWAITSTVSGAGDTGADPNKLVAITDRVSATTAGAQGFTTVRSANADEVLRGVSFTPRWF
jgi:hypothetical protein